MRKEDKEYVKKVMSDSSLATNKVIAHVEAEMKERIHNRIESHVENTFGHTWWVGMIVLIWLAVLTVGLLVVSVNQYAGTEWHCTGEKVTVYSAVCHAPYSDEGKLYVPERTFTITGDKDSFDRSITYCQEAGFRITDFSVKEMCTGYEYLMKT